ncbi:unnamed protein product [Spirodela intermedia]|uniref:Tyrosinase copper-binding domain-containing protein n=1 Tax=Spirodela intermedia TaxID=51605 RepID=A0A7I8L249_SPIIN|nr:unnamed protein product [Spirodela intermedia]
MVGMSQLISTTLSSPASPACPFQRCRRSQATAPRRPKAGRPAVISCESRPSERVDRREVLLVLGGMCTAGGLGVGRRGDALALPIQAPNLSECQTAGTSSGNNCCPPYSATILDYKFTPTGKLRVRRPVHKVDEAYLAKYKKTVELMRAPKCTAPIATAPTTNSWLFFPFHRFYLHFHERILGKLIGDDSFIFTDPNSSLYDEYRDPAHKPPVVLDLDYGNKSDYVPPIPQQQINRNLSIMYRQMISNAKTTTLFMGQPYRAGDNADPGAGENTPHGPIHLWVGTPEPCYVDMGVFYAAGRDPIFYSHHANVDRMWQVWKKLNPRNVDFKDRDWLDASFLCFPDILFYDEDARLVRVKVRDCLEPEMLEFTYQNVDLPWLSKRATPRATPAGKSRRGGRSCSNPRGGAATFPLTLSSLASITLKRPKVSRPQAEKDKQEETLVVNGIEFDPTNCVKFDVYVDDTDAGEVKPDDSEFAGSFVNVPHGKGHNEKMKSVKTTLRLGITDLLEDLKLDDDDEILVTLIPRTGKGKVKIERIRLELSS